MNAGNAGRGEARTLLLSGSHGAAASYFAGVMHGVLLSDPNATRWSHVSGCDAGSLPAALLAGQSLGSEDPIEIYHAAKTMNSKLSSGTLMCGLRMPRAWTARSNMNGAKKVLETFLIDDRVRQSGRVVCTGLLDHRSIYNPSYALRYHTPEQDMNADFAQAVLHSSVTLPLMGTATIGGGSYQQVGSSGMMVAPVPLNVNATRSETQFMAPTRVCDIVTTTPKGVRNLYHSVAFSRQLENTFTAVEGRSSAYTGSLYQLGTRFGIQFRLFAPRKTLPCAGMVYGQLSDADMETLFEIGRAVASRTVHSAQRGYVLDEYAPPMADGLGSAGETHVTIPPPPATTAVPPTARFLSSIALSEGQRPSRAARQHHPVC